MVNFNKILVANRGEIARRIIKTAHNMDYTCAVIYTNEEINSDFVNDADEAYCLGDGDITDTYLNIKKITDIAINNGIEAIHPGYGFLSENYEFARECEGKNLVFIGPTSDNIKLMSQKSVAREFVKSLGIKLLESVKGNNPEELLLQAHKLKFPVIVKADSGGGGKGMHIVYDPKQLKNTVETARREALAYFGDANVYIEEYLISSRHIEVQVIGDQYGNLIHLFDRECTIQRRHQKIIEEAPAYGLTEEIRNGIVNSSLKIAREMNYVSAGTLEFLLDENMNFYFLEMNTRIQVEHGVTEQITGIDIVKEQIQIAQGLPIEIRQEDISIHGYALEARIYAENPLNEFMPSAGTVVTYFEPADESIRIDSAITGPALISSKFDPMIAKVIVNEDNREKSRIKLVKSLQQYVIHGIETNISYLSELLNNKEFVNKNYSTSFCDDSKNIILSSFQHRYRNLSVELIISAFFIYTFQNNSTDNYNKSVWQSLGYWRNIMLAELEIFNDNYKVEFKKPDDDNFVFWINDGGPFYVTGKKDVSKVNFVYNGKKNLIYVSSVAEDYYMTLSGFTFTFKYLNNYRSNSSIQNTLNLFNQQNKVLAPLNGKIIKMNIKINEKVNKGDILMVLESMKMENHIIASRNGEITEIFVKNGDLVNGKDVLAVLS